MFIRENFLNLCFHFTNDLTAVLCNSEKNQHYFLHFLIALIAMYHIFDFDFTLVYPN